MILYDERTEEEEDVVAYQERVVRSSRNVPDLHFGGTRFESELSFRVFRRELRCFPPYLEVNTGTVS